MAWIMHYTRNVCRYLPRERQTGVPLCGVQTDRRNIFKALRMKTASILRQRGGIGKPAGSAGKYTWGA
jgi:hypothetical protein